MTETALKTKGDEVHHVLKLFKERFDDRGLGFYVPTLYRQVHLATEDLRYVCWRGEILHQLALYSWRQGDYAFANKLFARSRASFNDFEYQGLARVERDDGIRLVRAGEHKAGIALIEEALELHESDRKNRKGRRQRLVTEGYLLRANILAGRQVDASIDRLVELALEESIHLGFCLRDQHFVVDFARHCTSGSTRRALDIRMLDITTERGKIAGTIRSIANVVIDSELIVASKIFERLFGKE